MPNQVSLLGRKDPLATVWKAATIPSNLKKSQYASTNVLSSLGEFIDEFYYSKELIKSPKTPFELRKSAYLLFGVVRIHSKQVEYFLHDCKALKMGIRKAILSTKDAPYNSITLPKTFQLDSFDFEDDLHNLNRIEDTNLKNNEDITLQDEIPVPEDHILISEDVDEPEIMLDVVHDHHDPLWDDHVMDPDDDLEELMTMTDNGTANLEVEEMTENEEPPSVISADQVQEFTINPHEISFGHQSADHLVLQSTPKPMRKRRKLLIDTETKLESNLQLGTLKRRRKNALLFFLMNRSKLNKKCRKDGMSFEPLLNGLCDDLRNIFKEDIVSTKLKMASSQAGEEQDHAESSDGYSPPPGNDTNLLSTDDFTPSTCYKEDTIMSDIHEFDSSAEDLSFLNQEDRTPFGEQGGTTEFDTLPLRTRTVARFLQEKSPISQDLNLNAILQGKNKKMCVRMFYETLVLNNCGLVNVSQNEPYGDITLKVTSRLKEQLSTSSF